MPEGLRTSWMVHNVPEGTSDVADRLALVEHLFQQMFALILLANVRVCQECQCNGACNWLVDGVFVQSGGDGNTLPS